MGFRGELNQSTRHLDIPHHQSERFFFPVFAIPQSRDGNGIPGIACQVVPAESLYARESPRHEESQLPGGCCPHFRCGLIIVREKVRVTARVKIVVGPASRTGYGLRVKPTIAGVGVFRGTVVVERPIFHGGVRPVVRQSQHDGVARSAIRAIDVGIPIARVGGIEKLLQTVVTNGQVRRNTNRGALPPLACPDSEFVQPDWLCRPHVDFRDAGCGWRLRFKSANKSLQPSLSAFEMDFNALFGIQHPSVQGIGAGEAIDKRTEPHALHYSPNSNGTSAGHFVYVIYSCALLADYRNMQP